MRNLGLDILRFFAVVLVLGHHWGSSENSMWILKRWQMGGWVGVDLFFVISGYLISSLLFKEYQSTGRIRAGRFLFRRGFKIYPPFWVLILISVLLFYIVKQTKGLSQILAELFFVQNYWEGIWGYTWSLAVEEHFYLVLALYFGIFRFIDIARALKFIPIICTLVCLVCFFLRHEAITKAETYYYWMYAFKTHLRGDSICYGVLLSYFVHFKDLLKKTHRLQSWFLILLGFCFLFPAFIFPQNIHRWLLIGGVTYFYIGSGFILLAALRLKSSKKRFLRAIGVLGSASYSIYLWHIPVQFFGLPAFRSWFWGGQCNFGFWVYFLGSLFVGYVMYLWVEKPALRLRERFDHWLFDDELALRAAPEQVMSSSGF